AEAYAEWVRRGMPTNGRCWNDPPPQMPPPTVPQVACERCEKKLATTILVGVSGYAAYRCARMIPSLLPPLWPTIPANAVIP
ncbi:MAG TPA: hypothetical protein VF678_07080, partial [bacterium]